MIRKNSRISAGISEKSTSIVVLKAAWVLPITSEPIANACVLINGSKIEDIVSDTGLLESLAGRDHIMHDYKDAVILPGLINLHTHLEHTSLRPLATDAGLFKWLPQLMRATAKWSADDRSYSAQIGIEEAISYGTTTIVDCSYNGASAKSLAKSGVRSLIGLEIFGVNELSAEEQWSLWLNRLDALLEDNDIKRAHESCLLTFTAAPHSPYTACPAIWKKARDWAEKEQIVFITHLAESKNEYDWFNADDNTLKEFLIGAFSYRYPNFASTYNSEIIWKKGSRSSIDHLNKHDLLSKNLLAAHVVNVDDQDIDLLKTNDVAIAHCPRSNARLRCGRAPISKLKTKGLRIGLGTDGLASTDDLNLLSEGRFALGLHRACEPEINWQAKDIITHLTIKAAQCLNLENKIGSLEKDKLADIAVFEQKNDKYTKQNNAEQDPYDLLVHGNYNQLCSLFVNGQMIRG